MHRRQRYTTVTWLVPSTVHYLHSTTSGSQEIPWNHQLFIVRPMVPAILIFFFSFQQRLGLKGIPRHHKLFIVTSTCWKATLISPFTTTSFQPVRLTEKHLFHLFPSLPHTTNQPPMPSPTNIPWCLFHIHPFAGSCLKAIDGWHCDVIDVSTVKCPGTTRQHLLQTFLLLRHRVWTYWQEGIGTFGKFIASLLVTPPTGPQNNPISNPHPMVAFPFLSVSQFFAPNQVTYGRTDGSYSRMIWTIHNFVVF